MPVSLIILKKKVKKYNHTLILKKEYTRFIHSKKSILFLCLEKEKFYVI